MNGADGCKKRIDWIDFAKGFTMLLVVIGHSTGTSLLGMTIHQIIFSFHMPLFFVLSGMTFNPSDTVEEFKEKIFKNIKNLLIPFLITYIIFLLKDYSLFYKAYLEIGHEHSKIADLVNEPESKNERNKGRNFWSYAIGGFTILGAGLITGLLIYWNVKKKKV